MKALFLWLIVLKKPVEHFSSASEIINARLR